ncbi:hypothetical protein PMIN06_010993 [Paraphaeosphaeria minitans]
MAANCSRHSFHSFQSLQSTFSPVIANTSFNRHSLQSLQTLLSIDTHSIFLPPMATHTMSLPRLDDWSVHHRRSAQPRNLGGLPVKVHREGSPRISAPDVLVTPQTRFQRPTYLLPD